MAKRMMRLQMGPLEATLVAALVAGCPLKEKSQLELLAPEIEAAALDAHQNQAKFEQAKASFLAVSDDANEVSNSWASLLQAGDLAELRRQQIDMLTRCESIRTRVDEACALARRIEETAKRRDAACKKYRAIGEQDDRFETLCSETSPATSVSEPCAESKAQAKTMCDRIANSACCKKSGGTP